MDSLRDSLEEPLVEMLTDSLWDKLEDPDAVNVLVADSVIEVVVEELTD